MPKINISSISWDVEMLKGKEVNLKVVEKEIPERNEDAL